MYYMSYKLLNIDLIFKSVSKCYANDCLKMKNSFDYCLKLVKHDILFHISNIKITSVLSKVTIGSKNE